MSSQSATANERQRVELRDFYAILGAAPTASGAELRAAFREAVLQHHPDRSPDSALATLRTAILNRAWAELRDPLRRIHYDHALDRGNATRLAWPLERGEPVRGPTPRSRPTESVVSQPSPWHQPQWRSVAGFRVPADIWLAGPAAQHRWIVEHHIIGRDWRDHHERYWLRYAAAHYRDRGLVDDWLGTLERLVELDPSFETLVRAGLREAYRAAASELRGAAFLRSIGTRYPPNGSQRRWVSRELRALLSDFRASTARGSGPTERAETAELLLNYLEALELEPQFADVRTAIVAHRRAGNAARATELLDRAVALTGAEGRRWFSLVQLFTDAGELARASELLAEIARGEHPEALDRRQAGGDPVVRLAAGRRRLARAQRVRQRAAATRGQRSGKLPRGARGGEPDGSAQA